MQVSGSSGSRKFSFIRSSGIVPNSNFGVHGTSLSRPSTPSSTLSPTHKHFAIETEQRTGAKQRKPMQQHRSLLCDVFKPIKIITFKLCSLTNATHTKKSSLLLYNCFCMCSALQPEQYNTHTHTHTQSKLRPTCL